MNNANNHLEAIKKITSALTEAKRVLITAPGAADGDSIGAQLALRRMILQRFGHCEVEIINDEVIPPRYLFLPDIETVQVPESYEKKSGNWEFDIGFIVDGGVDRAGRVQDAFKKCKTTVLIDHHIISADYPYTIRIVEPKASATTEMLYHISQTKEFSMKVDTDFAQQIYLGLIFDTGFFRHSNTTPEAMELGAKLIREGFDFTRVGERGMLERSFSSLQLLSFTLSRSELRAGGKIIWSKLSQDSLDSFHAEGDDKEGIIDHMFLTSGIEVAVLFFELNNGTTKISFRSQGELNVAQFARSLTVQGGGHEKAAGANLSKPMEECIEWVLGELEKAITKLDNAV